MLHGNMGLVEHGRAQFVNIVAGERAILESQSLQYVAHAHLFAGEFREAHAAAQQMLAADPHSVAAVLVMAAIAVEHGNAPGADRLCQLARKTGENSCWINILEARIALLQQDQPAARAAAAIAAKIGTGDPHIANQLGVLLSRTGQHELATQPFGIAVTGVPDHPDYRYNYAIALQFAGELGAAERELAELVRRQPDHAKGWIALAQLAQVPDPEWDAHLAALFESSGDAETRLVTGHALARLAEGRSQWDTALGWLDRAKVAKARAVGHDRAGAEALSASAIRAAQAFAGEAAPTGDQTPVFITGMPRSGTTLVERILTSHPRVAALGELSDFGIELKRHSGTDGPLVLDPAVIAGAATAADLGPVGTAYLARIRAIDPHTPHLVDKMPFNIFFAPAILRAMPGARIICLRRSPFDVLFANYRQLFATGFSYYSYAYDFGDCAHFVAQFEAMAEAFEQSLPEGRFLSVRYEDVVADHRAQTERLLEFCGLEWDDACLHFHTNAQPVATASSVQVRSPIYSSSVEKWRRYSEGSQRAIAELAKYGIVP